MRGWVLAACAAVAVLAGEARAGESRQPIDVAWRQVGPEGSEDARHVARVPGGEITVKHYGPRRHFAVVIGDTECATMVDAEALALMRCGTRTRYYSLVQSPGKPLAVEWVTWSEGD
jgi:hypothetical protein